MTIMEVAASPTLQQISAASRQVLFAQLESWNRQTVSWISDEPAGENLQWTLHLHLQFVNKYFNRRRISLFEHVAHMKANVPATAAYMMGLW